MEKSIFYKFKMKNYSWQYFKEFFNKQSFIYLKKNCGKIVSPVDTQNDTKLAKLKK